MTTVLVVHHTPSPAMQELLEAAIAGTRAEGLEDVQVVLRPALTAGPVDVLAADGFVLGTPANIGYMSGALKHFFDGIYYPTLLAKTGAPYGFYVHGNTDGAGAVRAVESIAAGLGWSAVHAPVVVLGVPTKNDRDAVWDLAATVAASAAGLLAG
jgi:multimeric flavodoxin WrbA